MTGHVGSTSYVPLGVVDWPHADTPGAAVRPDNSTGPLLDVRGVEPVFVEDTSDATVAILVCNVDPIPAHWKAPDATSNIPLGCTSVAPFTPGKLDLNPNAHRLMVAVTPKKPGLDGAYVDYREGIRSGHQRVGERLRVTANGE